MKERTTQYLLAAVVLLLSAHLAAHLVRAVLPNVSSQAQEKAKDPAVLRAQAIELVDKQGQVRAQLYLGEDGGGNLRLRDATGTVRVKLGATMQGSGLLLLDQDVEPAIWMAVKHSETTLTLAEKGKEKKVIRP
jgi:hypothetical protein